MASKIPNLKHPTDHQVTQVNKPIKNDVWYLLQHAHVQPSQNTQDQYADVHNFFTMYQNTTNHGMKYAGNNMNCA